MSDISPTEPEPVAEGSHAGSTPEELTPAGSSLEAAAPAELVTPPPPRHGLARPVGKVRNPLGCWLLVLITLGIYGLFWYYLTNRELRDYDSSIEVNPGVAVICLFIPIVGLVSIYNTGKRISQAQVTAGLPSSASGVLGVILTFFADLSVPYYIANTNAIWREAANA